MKSMMRWAKENVFLFGFIGSIILSVLFLIFSLLLPTLISSNYYQRSLGQLRDEAKLIKNEFAKVIETVNTKRQMLIGPEFPQEKNEIFSLFKQLNLNVETEGIGYYKQSNLVLWLGNVFDLSSLLNDKDEELQFKGQKFSRLLQHKTSFYLVSFDKVANDGYIVFFRLIAFLPEIKAHYLKEYHFLKERHLENCSINYFDFREDVSGFERIFAKHKDEYIGQPRLQREIQTIFFPLRNESNKIIATVNLRSPSIYSKISNQKESLLLVFYLLVCISLVFLIIALLKPKSILKDKKLPAGLLVILILLGLRLLFFPLSNLEKIQSLSIFSPSTASFISYWNLTKSSADIFLTSLFLFLITGFVALYFRDAFSRERRIRRIKSLFLGAFLVLLSLVLLFQFQKILFRLVSHSSLNLLRFTFNPSFFLLHFSILLFFLVFLIISLTGMKMASLRPSHLFYFLPILVFESLMYLFIGKKEFPLHILIFQVFVILAIILIVSFPLAQRKKEYLFLSFLIFTLFIHVSLHHSTQIKNRSLLQNSLKNIITSQENWGTFLIKQSIPEIEKDEVAILALLKSHKSPDLAQRLWEKTLIAKFNWYSSLEISSPEETILSRFSLNVPELYRLSFEMPVNQEWSIFYANIPFMGKEKDFLVGYKDWFDKDSYLGRLTIYLSIDYDMLPFLYSANPYFELMRATSIPSLNQLDLGFAIFDSEGKLIFNPNKISAGMSFILLQKIQSSQDSIWASFIDKNTKYSSLYFKNNDRIYSLFLPQKDIFNFTVEFLKLLSFYVAVFLISSFIISILSGRNKLKNLFWSFSNRVYISFVAVALIPLLLFTFSTRSFFSQIFSQKFTEDAEVQADFAQRIMEDINFFQQEEQISLTIPPDDMVFWISSTISNDVNLYQEGKLISSSRREFFDYGLYPELINGEIYFRLQNENMPYYTQTQKIGDYSFHTLTVPFLLRNSLILISLPFPLEQQEISKATEELIEFLLFISVFFIAIVLLFARATGGMIITPIQRLLAGTKEVSLGNLEISIPHKHQDEMKTLIDGFNNMVKNLKKHQQELADMSKKVAWAEMARKVAHEIKNPLTPIQLSAEHLLRVYDDKRENFDDALKESVSYIIKEVEALRKIAHEFLEISKEASLHKEAIDIKEITQETLEPYKKMLSERIPIEENYKGEDFKFEGDKAKIKIALRNIITNAIEAIHEQGSIEVTVTSDKSELTLAIKDTGIGIRDDVLSKIFEPYFSTKDVGTGLGLPIAKKIVEDHGGSISASSKKNEGTLILIKLPQK